MNICITKFSFSYIIETSHSLYIYLFGQHSLQKYLDRGIIIINQEGKPPITPPGKEKDIKMSKLTSSPFSAIIISQVNPDTNGTGWKEDFGMCANKTGEDFITCIERIAFLQNDLITGYRINETVDLNNSISYDLFQVKSYYRNMWEGLIQSVEITNDKVISHTTSSSLTFLLNSNLSYYIYIMDKKFQFVMSSPDVLPRSYLVFKAESGSKYVYLKAVRHEKLNLASNPCGPDPEYSMADCIQKSIITKAGCQPHWRRVTVDEIPVCDNVSMILRYDEEFWKYIDLSRRELFGESKCRLPCSFMEYKVSYI